MSRSDTRGKLRAVVFAALVALSMFTATVSLSGTAAANAEGVSLTDEDVDAGTQLEGSVSLSDTSESTLRVVLDENNNDQYDAGTDKIVNASASSDPVLWDGLDTSNLGEGTYTVHAWDTDGSLSDGDSFPTEAVTTNVTIDNTDPTATVTSLNETTVTGGETVEVTYDATDDGSQDTGVQSAEIEVVNTSTDSVESSTTVTNGTGETVNVTAPTDNGTYDVRLTVTDNASNTATDAETLVVDTTAPSVGLLSPDDGAELTSPPAELVAKANDNVDVSTVEFRIQNEDDDYYDGSGWQTGEQWVSATYAADEDTWEYAAADNGIEGNGSYTVVARATDGAGSQTTSPNSGTTSTAPLPPTGDDDLDGTVNYTVDLRDPAITDVTVTTGDGDGVVAAGDEVTVSVNVSDRTSGVETVTVDASALGESETLGLSHESGDHWNRTVTVAAAKNGGIAVADGSHTLTATATDAFGQSSDATSNTFTIDTRVATIDDITIQPGFDRKFVGVVDDTDVRVTATGITDANGNPVTVGTVEISVADETPFDSVAVDDGEINTTIDPTKLPDDFGRTGDSVEVDINRTGSTATTVELVHEVRVLEEGWHLGGTPLPAQDVLLAGDGMMYAYEPDSATGDNWTEFTDTTRMEAPGSGYYFNITSDEARVGYLFEETSDSYTTELEPGYNLVGVVANIDDGTTQSPLGQYIDDTSTVANSTRIEYHVEDTSESDGNSEVLPYTDSANSDTYEDAYSAYFVEVTEEKEDPVVVTVHSDGYLP